jgi:hypothetical protein
MRVKNEETLSVTERPDDEKAAASKRKKRRLEKDAPEKALRGPDKIHKDSIDSLKSNRRNPFIKRELKVSDMGYRKDGLYRYVPYVRLRGIWLEQIGFEIGKILSITAEQNRLVIELKE